MLEAPGSNATQRPRLPLLSLPFPTTWPKHMSNCLRAGRSSLPVRAALLFLELFLARHSTPVHQRERSYLAHSALAFDVDSC
jgi:hypothetical protein